MEKSTLSVSDNILLNDNQGLNPAEEEAGQGFVSGDDWQIMTEEEYQAQQAVRKEESSPLLACKGCLTEMMKWFYPKNVHVMS